MFWQYCVYRVGEFLKLHPPRTTHNNYTLTAKMAVCGGTRVNNSPQDQKFQSARLLQQHLLSHGFPTLVLKNDLHKEFRPLGDLSETEGELTGPSCSSTGSPIQLLDHSGLTSTVYSTYKWQNVVGVGGVCKGVCKLLFLLSVHLLFPPTSTLARNTAY